MRAKWFFDKVGLNRKVMNNDGTPWLNVPIPLQVNTTIRDANFLNKVLKRRARKGYRVHSIFCKNPDCLKCNA